jgi:hypothetical protein
MAIPPNVVRAKRASLFENRGPGDSGDMVRQGTDSFASQAALSVGQLTGGFGRRG